MQEINECLTFKSPPSDSVGGIFCLKKQWLVVSFVFFSSLIFSQAIIKVEDAKQSFGDVKKGVVVELNYVLTNIGTEPLLIYKYEVECSCTSVLFDDKPILPGKSTTLTVKFDTKTVYERQDRIVLISSNNKNGTIKLRFKGFVHRK